MLLSTKVKGGDAKSAEKVCVEGGGKWWGFLPALGDQKKVLGYCHVAWSRLHRGPKYLRPMGTGATELHCRNGVCSCHCTPSGFTPDCIH